MFILPQFKATTCFYITLVLFVYSLLVIGDYVTETNYSMHA